MRKVCGRCGIEKDGTDFDADKRTKTGLSSYCKPCRREYANAYKRRKWAEDPEAARKAKREEMRAQRAADPERFKEQRLAHHRRLREAALAAYGGRCGCCGEGTAQFLQVDHVEGGGGDHRREIGQAKTYAWLKRHDYPEGFRILCANCNWSRGVWGYCPHER